MASKVHVAAATLCCVLALGTPAVHPAPAMAAPLPASTASDDSFVSEEIIRIDAAAFTFKNAEVTTAGCLRQRASDGSIVVDIDRHSRSKGMQTGSVICRWSAVAIDADGDVCDLELSVEDLEVDSSAGGTVVLAPATFYENGGGIAIGCLDTDDSDIAFTAYIRAYKSGTTAAARGAIPFRIAHAGDTKERSGLASLLSGLQQDAQNYAGTVGARRESTSIAADAVLTQLTWSGCGAIELVPDATDNIGSADRTTESKGSDDERARANPPEPEMSSSVSAAVSKTAQETIMVSDGGKTLETTAAAQDDQSPSSKGVENFVAFVATDQTQSLDPSSTGVRATSPKRKGALITLPKTFQLEYLPSGEVVAPEIYTIIGAMGASDDIEEISVSDSATKALLHLYETSSDGTKTEMFDGTKLVQRRRVLAYEDVACTVELVGFDRARDAQTIAAAIEEPQRLMTLVFGFTPILS